MTVPYTYYVDSARGSDTNSGLSEQTSWKTFAPLRAAIVALGVGGSFTAYANVNTLDDHLRIGPGVAANVHVTVVLAENSVCRGTSGVDQSFTDNTLGPYTLEIIGFGKNQPRITGFDTGSGNGLGVTSDLGARLIARNLRVDGCVDGVSAHGSLAYIEVYGCLFTGNSKSAFAHVHTGGSFYAKNCTFEGGVGATLGIGAETTPASATSVYEDCVFTPNVAGQAVTFKQARLERCVLGTMTLWCATTGGAAPFGDANGPTTVNNSFVNVVWDQNSPVNFTGCYGFMNIRQRNFTVGSIIDRCCFKGLASSDPFLYQSFDPGSAATLIVRNTVLTGFGTALGSGFTATNAGYFSASDSRAEYLCLFNNTLNIDADLAALGTPYVANNITSNPLLGPCNSTTKNAWAIAANSPCIGAGRNGTDIGFQISQGNTNMGTQYTYYHGVYIVDSSGVPLTPTSGLAQGSTTAGQLGTLDMGAVTTANPAYTNGQTSPLSLTPAGGLRTALYSAAGTAFVTDVSGNFITRVVSSPLGGHTTGRVMSAASTNATSLKASSGNLYGVHLHNSGVAAVFFKLYNKASAPTVGTDTPVTTISIAAGGRVDFDNVTGEAFSTGIAYAITNLVADSDTTVVLLNQVTGHLLYS